MDKNEPGAEVSDVVNVVLRIICTQEVRSFLRGYEKATGPTFMNSALIEELIIREFQGKYPKTWIVQEYKHLMEIKNLINSPWKK